MAIPVTETADTVSWQSLASSSKDLREHGPLAAHVSSRASLDRSMKTRELRVPG